MFRQVELPTGVEGRLYLHSMPGRYEPVEHAISEIQRLGIARIVSLAPISEIRGKSPTYATAVEAGSLPCAQVIVPIPDYGVPENPDEFLACAASVASALRAGEDTLVHCGAGIGRTGTFGTVVLMCLGLDLDKALARVRRAGSGPETPAQRDLLKHLADSIVRG